MPAPQSSRAGLITTIVILAICFLGVLIWAITENGAKTEALKNVDELKLANSKLVAAADSQNVQALEALRAPLNLGKNETVLNIAEAETKLLSQAINGRAEATTQAAGDAADKLAAARSALVKLQIINPDDKIPDSLTAAVQYLLDQLQKQASATDQAEKKATVAEGALKDAQTAFDAAKADYQKQVTQARQDADAVRADAAKTIDANNLLVKQAQDAESQEKTAAVAAAQAAQVLLDREKQAEAQVTKQLSDAQDKLAALRPRPGDNMLRQSDGTIIQTLDNTCYIDLGFGDHITPGLTFEVYDKGQGVPSMSASEDTLPIGKGSIEVIHIGQNSSECRVVKLEPGATIVRGDIIANLVYDKNTTYSFTVYGAFDLAHSGTPKPEDAEQIKRLVEAFGGKISPDVTIDTDFLVLGEEPKVPVLSDEEKDDAVQIARYDNAVAEQKKYDDIKQKARDLSIPVLNQNRFLYLIGYYDLATR